MSAPGATPQHTPGPEFGLTERQKEALIERQSAELVQLRNLNADLLAALQPFAHYSASLLIAIPDNKILEDMIAAAFEAIAKAEGRNQ